MHGLNEIHSQSILSLDLSHVDIIAEAVQLAAEGSQETTACGLQVHVGCHDCIARKQFYVDHGDEREEVVASISVGRSRGIGSRQR